MFFGKRKQIENQLNRYIELFSECSENFKLGMEFYLEGGISEKFNAQVDKTHAIESEMDDIRRATSYELYKKAILPDSRGDILYIFSVAEKLPDLLENILFSIQCELITIPEPLIPDLKLLLDSTNEALSLTGHSFKALFTHPELILTYASQIGDLESNCDRIGRRMVKSLFQLPYDNGKKVILKTLIRSIESISDRAETFSDTLVISSVKGKV